MILLIFLSLFGQQANASKIGDVWRSFCERHLIADDPYQFEDLSDEQLIRTYEMALDNDDAKLIKLITQEMARRGR